MVRMLQLYCPIKRRLTHVLPPHSQLFDAQHASHQAVKPRSREILSRLAVLTVRNGSFIALSQLAFLIISLSNDTSTSPFLPNGYKMRDADEQAVSLF